MEQTLFILNPFIEKFLKVNSSICFLETFEITSLLHRRDVTLLCGFSFARLIEVPRDRAPDVKYKFSIKIQ